MLSVEFVLGVFLLLFAFALKLLKLRFKSRLGGFEERLMRPPDLSPGLAWPPPLPGVLFGSVGISGGLEMPAAPVAVGPSAARGLFGGCCCC